MPVSIEDRVPNGRLDRPLRPNMEPIHALCDYDPRFCNVVHELGMQGKSYAEMCAAIGVSKKRSEVWRSKYEEYDEAVHAALTAAEAYLNDQGARNIEYADARGNPQFRTDIWKELKIDYKPIAKQDEEPKQSIESELFKEHKQKYLDKEV